MTPHIAKLRLHNQQIESPSFTNTTELITWLGAMQAQDLPGAMWSVGMRLPGTTYTDIERSIADKQIVRTWPMRGTLHFIPPSDVRWMQTLMTPKIMSAAKRRHEQLGLDNALLSRGIELFAKALQGGKQFTRKEMLDVLEQAGIRTDGQRGYHMIWWAAQMSVLCFGPMQGKQPTFVLLDEWIPGQKKLDRDEALATVTKRFFTSHGPALLKDFTWWTGLTLADARAGLAMHGDQFVQETVDDQIYWMSRDIQATEISTTNVHLLPGFDEYLLGYTDRRVAVDHENAAKVVPGYNGVFLPTIVINGKVEGLWKRTIKSKAVHISLQPFKTFTKAETAAISRAAQQYGNFIGLPAILES